MLVKIEEIQAQGLDLTVPIERKVLDEALSASRDFSLVSAGPLKVSFQKVSGQVHVQGGFGASVKAPCKRCLKDVQLEVPVAFALRMVAGPAKRDEDEEDEEDEALLDPKRRQRAEDDERAEAAGSFELDAVDAEPFDGKTIDLDPILREQVLLALPVSVVCRDDCKGLCGSCGQDLNEKDCGHSQKKELDPRLAKLKEIKLKH